MYASTSFVIAAWTLLLSQLNAANQPSRFGNLNLCRYLGAHCADNCGDNQELRHKWGIPLCKNYLRCCTYPRRAPTTGDKAGESSCRRKQGTCQAWYHSCNGTVATELDCEHNWQSCCVPNAGSTDYVGASRDISESSLGSGPPSDSSSQQAESLVPPNPQETRASGRGSSSDSSSSTNSVGQCGHTVVHRQKRIVGGTLSPRGMWPWHVGIKSALGRTYCSATIIRNNWVLTAAHCFKRVRDKSFYRIVAGTSSNQTHGSYAIKRIIKHNLYEEHPHLNNHIGHAHKYDIALVELEQGLTYNSEVQPACLPTSEDNFESKTCWLVGWGSTGNVNLDEFRLRHVRGEVLTKSRCQTLWGRLVDGKMLCFGNEREGACQGDSGGGMFCEGDDGRYTLAGVISWGSAQCNRRATVLTDITQYTDWILQHINT